MDRSVNSKREDQLRWGECDVGGKSGVQLDVVYWLVIRQFTHKGRAWSIARRRQTPQAWTTVRSRSWRSAGCRCRGWCSWKNRRGYQRNENFCLCQLGYCDEKFRLYVHSCQWPWSRNWSQTCRRLIFPLWVVSYNLTIWHCN